MAKRKMSIADNHFALALFGYPPMTNVYKLRSLIEFPLFSFDDVEFSYDSCHQKGFVAYKLNTHPLFCAEANASNANPLTQRDGIPKTLCRFCKNRISSVAIEVASPLKSIR